MSKRIKDDELKELARLYNDEGKEHLYNLLRDCICQPKIRSTAH
jgi:hypothetical protein